jgi:subtilase family serine protease
VRVNGLSRIVSAGSHPGGLAPWFPKVASSACALVLACGLVPIVTAAGGNFAVPDIYQRLMNRSQPPTSDQCLQAMKIKCYDPAQIQTAYNLQPLFSAGTDGAGETIVLVDAFGSPTMQKDLTTFDRTFGLPGPPSFKVIQPAGTVPPYTATSAQVGWAGETTLDVEWAHVMAPHANILLVLTPVDETEGMAGFPQIIEAENYVINHHLGDVISQSFGATEQTFPSPASIYSLRSAYVNAAAHGVTVLASSGDTGVAGYANAAATQFYPFKVVDWPASDPLVTGVGATALRLDASGNRLSPDVAWNDTFNNTVREDFAASVTPTPFASSGGVSEVFPRPSFQGSVVSTTGPARGVPDIAMSGACSGTVDVYSSTLGGWNVTCGSSEASALFAGVVALADQVAGHPLGLINPALYVMGAEHAPGIVPVTQGSNSVSFTQNGETYTLDGYSGNPNYSLVTGLGTVNAAQFVPELAETAIALSPPGQ